MYCWRGYIYFFGYIMVYLASSRVSFSQNLDISNSDLESNIDAFVNELLRCRKLVGANIAIVRGKDTLISKGYGVVSMETNETVTTQSLFGIASLSKAFTATLLGVVLDKSTQGYTWDTKVRDILGDDFFFNNAELTTQVTLRDLLTHRTGLDSNNNLRHQSGLDRATLAYKVRFLEPLMPFRSEFKYNNLMYGLLTHVTEVIGGETWENLMRRHIFEPLRMTSSEFTHEVDLSRSDLVTSYQVDYDGTMRPMSPQLHSYWGKLGGSGSLISNAEDMSKWLKTLINNGTNENGDQVIPYDVIKESFTRFMSIKDTESERMFLQPQVPVSFSHFEYGLAWRIGFYRGWRTVLHTGTSLGYLAQLTLIPDLNIAIHSSLSGDDPGHTGRRLLHIYLMDLLLGESPWLNLTSACEFPQTRRYRNEYGHNQVQPSRRRKDIDTNLYVGTYGDFAYGNVTIYANESTGDLILAYGDLGRWTLVSRAEDHHFDAIGMSYVWTWIFNDVAFSHSGDSDVSGPFDIFDIPGARTFTRGLRMDEAPPPPSLKCETSTSNTFTSSKILIYALVVWTSSFQFTYSS